MRILIHTFPPNSNANYGGVLQAWALQRTLNSLGHEAIVNSTAIPGNHAIPFRNRVKALTRVALASTAPFALPEGAMRRITVDRANRTVLEFAPKHIRTQPLYLKNRSTDRQLLDSVDAFVVGSDQVWRPRYANVPSYLLDFLAEYDPRPRVAYAASFGTDSPEFNSELANRTRKLARRFTSLSVREQSAIGVAKQLWGVEATRLVDPTLLVSPDEYLQLTEASTPPATTDTVLAYVLDQHANSANAIRDIGGHLGASPISVLPAAPKSLRAYRRNPAAFAWPTVDAWIASLASARHVITDSFHGTVFAILFNVPFTAVVNRRRGAARFETLLSTLGLSERLAEPGHPIPLDSIFGEIDWFRVNSLIAEEKHNSVNYLRTALSL